MSDEEGVNRMDWLLMLTVAVLVLGFIGTLAPAIPGIPLMFLAMLGYDWSTGFQSLGYWFLAGMLVITLLSLVVDYVFEVYGAQRFGASRWGIIGLIVGGIAGIIVLGPVGIVLGPLVGVLVGELLGGRDFGAAVISGWGTLLGLVVGSIIRISMALIMMIAFFMKIW